MSEERRPANHASRPTAQRLSPDKQILPPPRVNALLRFANNRKLVCAEPFLAMASRTKTSLPSDAENTGYDDEKSFSTTPRSCQKLTSVDAGDSFFCFFCFVCSKLVKYESGILNQPFSLIARRCQVPAALSRTSIQPFLPGRLLLVGHSSLRWHRVLASNALLLLLLLLHVLLVGNLLLLLGCNVVGVDSRISPRHGSLWCGNLWVTDFLRRIRCGFSINTVLSAWRRLRCVQTSL